MEFNLESLLASWAEMDIFDIALPFLLVFTIIFAILEKSKVLGKESRKFNIIIAAILGLLVVRNATVVNLIHRLLPNISLIVVAIIMFLLLIGIFMGKEFSGLTGGLMGIVVLVSIVLVLWSLGSEELGVTMPTMPDWLTDFIVGINSASLIAVILFVAALVLILGKGKSGGKNIGQIIGDGLKKLGSGFGGG